MSANPFKYKLLLIDIMINYLKLCNFMFMLISSINKNIIETLNMNMYFNKNIRKDGFEDFSYPITSTDHDIFEKECA